MALALDFDWHDRKAAANLEKQGVSVPEAVDVFADPQRIDFDVSRSTDGEERRKTVGMLDGKLMTVVDTRRGSVLGISAARRANRTEAKRYGQG